MTLPKDREHWVAADYAAYYERERKGIQRPWRFNKLVEVIAVAIDDAHWKGKEAEELEA